MNCAQERCAVRGVGAGKDTAGYEPYEVVALRAMHGCYSALGDISGLAEKPVCAGRRDVRFSDRSGRCQAVFDGYRKSLANPKPSSSLLNSTPQSGRSLCSATFLFSESGDNLSADGRYLRDMLLNLDFDFISLGRINSQGVSTPRSCLGVAEGRTEQFIGVL